MSWYRQLSYLQDNCEERVAFDGNVTATFFRPHVHAAPAPLQVDQGSYATIEGANTAIMREIDGERRKDIWERTENHQLSENRRVDGKPRQKVLVHLGSHATVESALTEWPREIKRLRRFAQRKREEAERLSEDPATMTIRRTALERAEKAERRADSLETNLKKLRELKKQDVV